MPSEISAPAGMQSALSPSLPLRLLTKGPSYLRSQMEGDRRDRPSAVERLAADRAKYVKSPTARGRKLEPSALGSSSSEEDSSSGASSNRENYLQPSSHQRTGQQELQPSIVRRSGLKRQLRPDSLVIYRQKCEFVRGAATTSSNRSSKSNRSLVRRLLPGSGGRGDTPLQSEAERTLGEGLADGTEPAAPRGATASTPAAPQGAATDKPAAPQGATTDKPAAPQGATTDKSAAPQGAATDKPAAPQGAATSTSAAPQGDSGRTKEPLKRRGGGVGLRRSHSDLSYRYSRACSGLDSFFEQCGLEPEVMEDLLREKFAATTTDRLTLKFRSVSSPDSESELSRHSSNNSGGSERLRVQKKPPPSALSVIERNARVIQWLYGCKRAQESKGKPAAVLV